MENTKNMCITTSDNPFNPFEQFEEWRNYDIQKGYYTCEKLARLAPTSNKLTDYENDELILEAIEEMIAQPVMDKEGNMTVYIKVYKD